MKVMKNYQVYFEQVNAEMIEVEAGSREEAMSLARKGWMPSGHIKDIVEGKQVFLYCPICKEKCESAGCDHPKHYECKEHGCFEMIGKGALFG